MKIPPLTALLAVAALTAPGPATAAYPQPGDDCCFAPPRVASPPVPAGALRVGQVGTTFGAVLIRRTDGTLLAAEYGGETIATSRFFPLMTVGSRPIPRDWQLGDVDGDGDDDLITRVGSAVSASPLAAGRFGAPRLLLRVPRDFAELTATRIFDPQGAVDFVARDPRRGRLRVIENFVSGGGFVHDGWPSPRGFALHAEDIDGDGSDDLVAYRPASGRVRVLFCDLTGFDALGPDWRIPRGAEIALADFTGDGLTDLAFRPHGSDAVSVRRAYQNDEETGWHTARFWGRWPRRLALTPAYLFGDRAGLVARDPRSGRLVVATSRATPAQPLV